MRQKGGAMTLRDFRNCIEFNLEHGIRHAVLGLGAPGLGKSQVIRQIGEKYGYKVIDLRLAQMSEVEIGGLIYPNEDRTKTVWLAPDILPDEERDGKKTILLLDEITSCSKRVQVAAYQLVLDRRVGQYRLPEG
nr:AAA family ATPase [Lachnospiraceae bacterium]